MRRSSPRQSVPLTVLGVMTALVGCSGGNATPASSPPPSTVAVPAADDGVLTIGVLTPQGSANADIGQAIGSAVELAVDTINAAGGYGGRDVVRVSADEGVTGAGIDPAIATLLAKNVDAIIGPASSTNALAGLGEIVQAGVVSCSPTASSALLDAFPDQNLFFRTIPSDSLQALALAEAVDRTGVSRVTVAYIDDPYGQPFADAVDAALRTKNLDITLSVPYQGDNTSIAAAAKKVASISPGVVVLIGDATAGPVMLGAIDRESDGRPVYVVNDAMRRPAASAEPMGASLASRVTGVSPAAFSRDAQFLTALGATSANPSPYAGNAYDCVNLVALAAQAAGSTLPSAIAAQIPAVSDSGSPCATFADCVVEIKAGNNINYDGPAGPVVLGSDGELAAADFELFEFDEVGRDVRRGTLSVRR